MKKFLLLSILTIALSLNGLTQSSSPNPCDCPSEADQKKVLIAAQQGKLAKEKVIQLEKIIVQNEERILGLQRQIAIYEKMDTADQHIISTYKAEIVNLEATIETYKREVKLLETALKKEKRKRFWTTLAGIVSTVGAIVLFK